MIIKKARDKIELFNRLGVHYNIVANYVYQERKFIKDKFGPEYISYIIAALITFDMGRMMGKEAEKKYDLMAGGFATKLYNKLGNIKSRIGHLVHTDILTIDLKEEHECIEDAYRELSAGGENGLNQRKGQFHVGATKILHFINPELFLIVDSNASRAFKRYHGINYRNTTQPGYTSHKYIDCMRCAKTDIIAFGKRNFRNLESETPMARIYDKLTFATGSNWP